MSVIAWSYEEENTFSMINYLLCRTKNGFSHENLFRILILMRYSKALIISNIEHVILMIDR